MSVKDHRVRAHTYSAIMVQLTGGNLLCCCNLILSPPSPPMLTRVPEMGHEQFRHMRLLENLLTARRETPPTTSFKTNSLLAVCCQQWRGWPPLYAPICPSSWYLVTDASTCRFLQCWWAAGREMAVHTAELGTALLASSVILWTA